MKALPVTWHASFRGASPRKELVVWSFPCFEKKARRSPTDQREREKSPLRQAGCSLFLSFGSLATGTALGQPTPFTHLPPWFLTLGTDLGPAPLFDHADLVDDFAETQNRQRREESEFALMNPEDRSSVAQTYTSHLLAGEPDSKYSGDPVEPQCTVGSVSSGYLAVCQEWDGYEVKRKSQVLEALCRRLWCFVFFCLWPVLSRFSLTILLCLDVSFRVPRHHHLGCFLRHRSILRAIRLQCSLKRSDRCCSHSSAYPSSLPF